jgi:hypothetical protein
MQTRRFGRKIKLPSTIAIKHQMRKLALEEALKAENNNKAIAINQDGPDREMTKNGR